MGAVDAVVLPGGFAHGDYLRPGAIARFSPVMDGVRAFAADGGPVVGHLQRLPGAHRGRAAPGRPAEEPRPQVPVHHHDASASRPRSTPLTAEATVGDELRIPINHFEGNYTCDADTLAELRAEDRVVVRYVDNPNGSVDDIAGVCNEGRNVVGLMPHPERACHPLVGSNDGAVLLRSLLVSAGACRRAAQLERLMPGSLQHGGLHAQLAPGGVGDALARAVGRGGARRTPSRAR